jgi:catechol 2,3-dioxygenase-like lactoylglutathione lyase family enzyme
MTQSNNSDMRGSTIRHLPQARSRCSSHFAPSQVDECAEDLRAAGVRLVDEPKNQLWGHRTLFFRDPDGNVIEIYAEL